jgi:hypothetical protein
MISGGALAVALLLPGAIGAAGTSGETKLRLDVHAAADCTSRGDVAGRIGARSPRIQIVDDAEVTAVVTVTSPRPGSVVADLVMATTGAEPSPRRFVARSCAEAADAVALSIAVTLDPSAARRSPAERDVNALPGSGTATAPPAVEAPKPPDAPADAPSNAAPPIAVTTPAAPTPVSPVRRHFGTHVAGQMIFGPAPVVMPGIAVYGMAALERDGLWAPALFLGATRVWSGGVTEADGTASFILDAGTLDVCPLRVRWSALSARPCASLLFGRLNARGTETESAANVSRPFGAAGLAVSASVGAPIEVTARAGVGVTLIRDSYEFAASIFHRAARVTASASLGVGFRWP